MKENICHRHGLIKLISGFSLMGITTMAQPVITTAPVSQTVVLGGNTTFSVAASGTGPFTYQWQFNGTNLPNGIISTVAGNGTNIISSKIGDNGPATNAILSQPYGTAMDSSGNLYIADRGNGRIRKVSTSGVITTIAGNGTGGIVGYSGDGGPATNASMNLPTSVSVDSLGNVFIADCGNNRVRKVDTNGIITTVAGGGSNKIGDGGAATNATLSNPYGVVLDVFGNLYIGDSLNYRVRKVDTNGLITTVAGGGTKISGNGYNATNADLGEPRGLTIDTNGNLFFSDTSNNRIYQVNSNGILVAFAGGGARIPSNGGAATNADLNAPDGVALDMYGNLFIADTSYQIICKVDTNGLISSVAGMGESNGYSGDDGAATNALLFDPEGVMVDGVGNLFISDMANNRIRKVDYSGGQPALQLNEVSTNSIGNYTVVLTGGGGSVTSSVVSLTVVPPGYNQIVFQLILTNQMKLSFIGLPGTNYALDRTFQLAAANWIPQVTNPASSIGALIFTNTPDASTNNFWRIRSVP